MKTTTKLITLFLALALLCGCQSGSKAPDDSSVVAKIFDSELTLGEFNQRFQQYADYYYAQTGLDLTLEENFEIAAKAREALINEIVMQSIQEAKVEELGLDTFTAEETTKIQENARVQYDYYRQNFLLQYQQSGAANAEELTEQTMAAYGFTIEALEQEARDKYAVKKLKQMIVSDVEVTEEDLKAAYEQQKESMKDYIDGNNDLFVSYWNADLVMLYRIGGYSTYLWLHFPIEEALAKELDELESTADASYAAKRDQYLFAAKTDAEKAAQELAAGASFDDLFAEIGAGSRYDAQSIPQDGQGYCIGKNSEELPQSVRETALALKEDGEISPPVAANDGYYIIKKIGDIQAGEMTFEEAQEYFGPTVLADKQNAAYIQQLKDWIAEEGIEVYLDVINYQYK